MDILRDECGSCTETCPTSSGDGNQFLFVNIDDVANIKEEEDPESTTSTEIKNESANCMDVLRDEHSSCIEICPSSSGDKNQFLFVNVEEVTDVKEDAEPTTSPVIKVEPVNCVNILRSDPASCSETCLWSCDDDGQVIDIKVEEVNDIKEEEESEQETVTAVRPEPANNVNEQLCARSGRRAFSCDACGKAFGRKGDLIEHKRIHSGERPYLCDVCNKPFSRHNSLIRHKRIHSGDRPYSCGVCNKSFTVKCNLIVHQRIHSGEQPYSCDVCSKPFSRQNSLIRHQRIHSGECPYSCDVCNKAFSQQSNLITHQRIHSGERPFACDVCNDAFSDKRSLQKHEFLHSGKHPYSCGLCSKTFAYKNSLVKHQRRHHL